MADHFVGINRGVEGEKYSDFSTGVATTGADFEVRITDKTAPNIPTRTDVEKAMLAFRRFFENSQQWTAAGFVING